MYTFPTFVCDVFPFVFSLLLISSLFLADDVYPNCDGVGLQQTLGSSDGCPDGVSRSSIVYVACDPDLNPGYIYAVSEPSVCANITLGIFANFTLN